MPTTAQEGLGVHGLGHTCSTNFFSPCTQLAMAESTFPLMWCESESILTWGRRGGFNVWKGPGEEKGVCRRNWAVGNQKDSFVLLAPIDLLKSLSFCESLQSSVCSEYPRDNNKVSFIKYVCSVERKLLKIKELLYL